jgi:hypothetical protein
LAAKLLNLGSKLGQIVGASGADRAWWMKAAMARISPSFMPRVVTAGVPNLMPLVTVLG